MDKLELRELILRFQKEIKEESALNYIRHNPKTLLILRMSLDLSQKQFIEKLNKKISQAALIRHEKGRSFRINNDFMNEIAKLLPISIDAEKIMKNYLKFESMKKGSHMTTKRAQELYKMSLKNFNKTKLSEWGRNGALITNTKQRLTRQERKIKTIQAYAYRCRLLKESYPRCKVGVIITDVPTSAKKIIENEFDFILKPDMAGDLSKFLQFQ